MPAVTRIGDADVLHCSIPKRAAGSSNVFVNGIGVSRQGDVNTAHLLPGASLQVGLQLIEQVMPILVLTQE